MPCLIWIDFMPLVASQNAEQQKSLYLEQSDKKRL